MVKNQKKAKMVIIVNEDLYIKNIKLKYIGEKTV